jgi:hypothetical protein
VGTSFPLGLHTKTESIESSSFGINKNIPKPHWVTLGNHQTHIPHWEIIKKTKIIVSLLSKDKQVEV